jgi:hypothetical protein
MVHSEKLCKRNNDASIPRKDGESDKYKIQEKSWKDEYRDFGIPLRTSVNSVLSMSSQLLTHITKRLGLFETVFVHTALF